MTVLIMTIIFMYILNGARLYDHQDCRISAIEESRENYKLQVRFGEMSTRRLSFYFQICFRPFNNSKEELKAYILYGSPCVFDGEYYYGIGLPILIQAPTVIDVWEYKLLLARFHPKFEIDDIYYDYLKSILEIRIWKTLYISGEYYCHIVGTSFSPSPASFSVAFSKEPATIQFDKKLFLTIRSKKEFYLENDQIVAVCDYLHGIKTPTITVSESIHIFLKYVQLCMHNVRAYKYLFWEMKRA